MVADKVALVTGGASGIGREAALLFAKEGARVWVVDCLSNAFEETVNLIQQRGGIAQGACVDVADESGVERALTGCIEAYGQLDCAVNSAGIAGPQSLLKDLSLEAFSGTVDTNLKGTFLSMKHELRAMEPAGRGAIVNISSGAGWIGTPGLGAYCATKHGVLGLTKTAALEMARTGIRGNAICPGSIDTPMLQASMRGDEAITAMIRSSMPIGRLGEAN
ncbi:SDR family NAD(P)-dependent oxidoreductase, partial [Myxococcota bacterium]|nr:SDR family NAD(P)-dependent oxidoreductase [Myxococcota bacterium]